MATKRDKKASAKRKIRETLERAQTYLKEAEGYESKIYIHENRDGSIDGELKVPGVRGVDSQDLLIAAHEALPEKKFVGIWVSVGARFDFQNEDDPYSRYKGLSQVRSHYRRYQPNKVAVAFLALGHTKRGVAKRVEKRARKKVDHVFVRLNWNPENAQPYQRRPKPKGGKK